MRFSRACSVLILLLSALAAFNPNQSPAVFPFSNFPMFSSVRLQPEAYALVINLRDGSRHFVAKSDLAPFTRPHIVQMISGSIQARVEGEEHLLWLEDLLRARVLKDDKEVHFISFERIRFRDVYKMDFGPSNADSTEIFRFGAGDE